MLKLLEIALKLFYFFNAKVQLTFSINICPKNSFRLQTEFGQGVISVICCLLVEQSHAISSVFRRLSHCCV